MKNSSEQQFITDFCNKIKVEHASKRDIAAQVYEAGYRLEVQQPTADSRANDNRLEADLNECIGQPQEDTTLLIHFLLDEINDADVNMRLDDAYELAQHLISVGYRKQ